MAVCTGLSLYLVLLPSAMVATNERDNIQREPNFDGLKAIHRRANWHPVLRRLVAGGCKPDCLSHVLQRQICVSTFSRRASTQIDLRIPHCPSNLRMARAANRGIDYLDVLRAGDEREDVSRTTEARQHHKVGSRLGRARSVATRVQSEAAQVWPEMDGAHPTHPSTVVNRQRRVRLPNFGAL